MDREITIDTIKIMPGYFDARWWDKNNRIKKLNIDYGENNYDVLFKDVMQIQKVEFPLPISFKKITFSIKDVYSGKDDDSGISEIEFWYRDHQITIDISG